MGLQLEGKRTVDRSRCNAVGSRVVSAQINNSGTLGKVRGSRAVRSEHHPVEEVKLASERVGNAIAFTRGFRAPEIKTLGNSSGLLLSN